MKKSTLYLLGILISIILGSYLNYIFCCNSTEIVLELEQQEANQLYTTNAFRLLDNSGGVVTKENDNFNFSLSESRVLLPISDNLNKAVSKSVSYFKNYPNDALSITGYYTSNEVNNSAYSNLGLARANAIKNYFVSKGLSSRHINTLGALNDKIVPSQDMILYGPNDFETISISDSEILAEEMNLIASEIKNKPLYLNFELAATTLKLTHEQRVKVEKIARYLDKVEDSKCTIVGHTDNTGNIESNVVLGQERADYARDYLVRNHISPLKITALSKGQSEPVESNDTEKGRAKNRRIVVTIN
jgi:outer membrane protein OmpA-like peptidoglycan-associated protein